MVARGEATVYEWPLLRLRMDDPQHQMLLKSVEVGITMEESVAAAYAVGGYDAVDCLSDSDSVRPKVAIVPSRRDRQRFATCVEHGKVPQLGCDRGEGTVAADTLQNLTKNQVCQSKWLDTHLSPQPKAL